MFSIQQTVSHSRLTRDEKSGTKNFHALLSALAFSAALTAPALSTSLHAADVTLTSANNSGYSWGTAGETLNVTLNSADKFSGTLNLTAGTMKFASNYAQNTLGSGARIVLGEGTSFDFNGTYLRPAEIVTTGDAVITSSKQNTQNGLGSITMGGNLTLNAPNRYCLEVGVDAGGYEIFKTGAAEIVVKTNITNLKALHITEGIWSVESSVTGFGDGDIYLENGTMKVWGDGRNISFGKLYYRGGTVDLYADDYSGTINLNGDIILEKDSANFRVSSTTRLTGDLNGAEKTLVHSARITPGANGDGTEQTGVWTFAGASQEDKGTTTLKNFQLTTRDSEIILADHAEWIISGAVEGKSTGHKFTIGQNASLTAAEVKGMKSLSINGSADIGILTMNQEAGILNVAAETNLDTLNVTQSSTLNLNAALTAGNVSIAEGVSVTKTGSAVFTVAAALTGNGNLIISEGTLTQSASGNPLDSFEGQITIGANGTLNLNGKHAQHGYPIKMLSGATITNSRDDQNVYWSGLLLDVEPNAEITLGGNARFAAAFHNNSANGATINVTNSNYLYLANPVKNADFRITGVVGLEGNAAFNASEGNDVFVTLTNGRITSWTGTNVHTHSVTQMTINNGIIAGNGHLVFNGDVLLEGNATFAPTAFSTNNLNYRSSLRLNGNITGNHSINASGVGELYFFGDVNVNSVNHSAGAFIIANGTFQANEFLVAKSYSEETLSGGTYENGLIIDGGTLLSPTSFSAPGQTLLMRGETSQMKLAGNVTDNQQTIYRIDEGTLTLDDGINLNGQLFLRDNAVLKLGLDDTKPASVTLNSPESLLEGEIIFNLFSNESFDQLTLADGNSLDGTLITLNPKTDETFSEMIPIVLGSFDEMNFALTNSNWALALGNGGVFAYQTNAVPEPASWFLLLVGLGLGWTRRRNRHHA
ncbi:MAG: PEP-CTERM sorting domain-containing protein [Thermoguttaceae bacterium]|nr:PEP-CTERM sorting domain-containing protein [Thermoguttaceae bacterium]